MAAGETYADLLQLLLDEGVHGELGGRQVLGLFDEPTAVEGLGGYGAAAAQPQYRMREVDVPAAVIDALLVLTFRQGPRRFSVREFSADGTGLVLLKLSIAP